MKPLVLVCLYTLFAFTSAAQADTRDSLPANVQSKIDHYVSQGNSVSGEELAKVMWRLGTEKSDYGRQMQSALSNDQLKTVYLYKIEDALNDPALELTREQREFIVNSKETTKRGFDEDWNGESEEYIRFTAQAEAILPPELLYRIYGALWPRTMQTASAD